MILTTLTQSILTAHSSVTFLLDQLLALPLDIPTDMLHSLGLHCADLVILQGAGVPGYGHQLGGADGWLGVIA